MFHHVQGVDRQEAGDFPGNWEFLSLLFYKLGKMKKLLKQEVSFHRSFLQLFVHFCIWRKKKEYCRHEYVDHDMNHTFKSQNNMGLP